MGTLVSSGQHDEAPGGCWGLLQAVLVGGARSLARGVATVLEMPRWVACRLSQSMVNAVRSNPAPTRAWGELFRPRSLSAVSSRSSTFSSIPCPTNRVRNSDSTEASNPGSSSSRPSAYFRSMPYRTRCAAARSEVLGELQHRHRRQLAR